jgi:hypothetical protein
MITVCHRCGNYTVLQGEEVVGARTMVRRLRDLLRDPDQRKAVIAKSSAISQLVVEVCLLEVGIQQVMLPQLNEVA